jgi:Caspase domain/Right handed beta helix region
MTRLIAIATILFVLAIPAAAAKRVALVIGNAAYAHVTPLGNPINDATLMETALKEAGFEVMRHDNLNRPAMGKVIAAFASSLKTGVEASMFYYAGHGIEANGKNYLVPVDANFEDTAQIESNAIDVNNFLSQLENTDVPFNIVVLDACRNNPFPKLTSNGGGLAPVLAPVGTYVAYATAPGSIAADGTGSNSPFTQALSASIGLPGLRLEDVFKETRSKVLATTKGQQTTYDSTAIVGTFYFHEPVRRGLKVTPLAPPKGKTIRVKPAEGDVYGSIVEAVKTAEAGDRIELAPGVYDATVMISKPIEIVGTGRAELVTIRGWNKDTLRWKAQGGLLANVTVKQLISPTCKNRCNALFVDGGSLTVQNTSFTSEDNSTVVLVGGKSAKAQFVNSAIANGESDGMTFWEKSEGSIEDSEIFSNNGDALGILDGASVVVRNTEIHDGKANGIVVGGFGAKAIVEGNTIAANAQVGIMIGPDADADVTNNVITGNRYVGADISLKGTARFTGNDMRGNLQGAWKIWDHAGEITREGNTE